VVVPIVVVKEGFGPVVFLHRAIVSTDLLVSRAMSDVRYHVVFVSVERLLMTLRIELVAV
jgi:hypothetical protein